MILLMILTYDLFLGKNPILISATYISLQYQTTVFSVFHTEWKHNNQVFPQSTNQQPVFIQENLMLLDTIYPSLSPLGKEGNAFWE